MRVQGFVLGLALAAAAGSAGAADMDLKAPFSPAQVRSWTGLYFGVHGGRFYGHTKVEENGVVTEPDAATNGQVGGLLGGYNWQTGPWVFGVEGDIGYSNAHGNGVRGTTTSSPNQYDVNWIAHGRGRIGYDYNQWLLFVAGGIAVADFTFTPGEDIVDVTCGGTFTGFSIGGGVERALAPGLIVRGEYLYDDFGSKTYNMMGMSDSYKVSLTGQSVRGALILKLP